MDNISKLFQKIHKKDRLRILKVLKKIHLKDKNLKIKKLKGFQHIFRVRVGDFLIIYFSDQEKTIIKAIKKRDESTYSDF